MPLFFSSSAARINQNKGLGERAIEELLQKNDILQEDIAIDAKDKVQRCKEHYDATDHTIIKSLHFI